MFRDEILYRGKSLNGKDVEIVVRIEDEHFERLILGVGKAKCALTMVNFQD